jgi:hypothetical protein
MNTPMENLSKGQQASRVTAEINNLYNSVDFLVRHSETPEKTLHRRLEQILRMTRKLERTWRLVLILALSVFSQSILHGEQPQATDAPKPFDLKNAVYGIPLGASLENVLLWCKTNQVTFDQFQKEDIKKFVSKTMSANRNVRDLLKDAKEEESNNLTAMEKLLGKLQEVDSTLDEMEKERNRQTAEEVHKYMDILKNPTFTYNGCTYYLFKQFDGLSIVLDGKKLACRDARITDTTYAMLVAPSGKLDDKNLNDVQISFYKDADGKLWSYAVSVSYHPYAESGLYNDMMSEVDKKRKLIGEALDAKYGPHKIQTFNEDTKYEEGWVELVKSRIGGIIWGGGARDSKWTWGWGEELPCGIIMTCGDEHLIYLYYADAKYTPQIDKLHNAALADFKCNCEKKQKEDAEKLKNNF